MAEILLLDNIDSFTYNLVDQLRVNLNKVTIFRNNYTKTEIINFIKSMKNPILMLSPGPGIPKNAGCMLDILKFFIGKIPIIGICLGHQAIIEVYGGKIVKSNEIIHGQTSYVIHDNQSMFKDIINPIKVARYHSLIGTNIPFNLTINATYNSIAMAVKDEKNKICGFQFHPESILTTYGNKLLKQTIKWALY